MLRDISKEKLNYLKEKYKKGMRVRLLCMNDPFSQLKQGEEGTIIVVDDIGTIHVSWDSGSSLGLAYGEDSCEIIHEKARTHFVRKACTINDLKGYLHERSHRYIIEEVVELESAEYKEFAADLLENSEFIAKRLTKMYVDAEKNWHCILIKAKGNKEGILVQSEGYLYARYAAYYPGE